MNIFLHHVTVYNFYQHSQQQNMFCKQNLAGKRFHNAAAARKLILGEKDDGVEESDVDDVSDHSDGNVLLENDNSDNARDNSSSDSEDTSASSEEQEVVIARGLKIGGRSYVSGRGRGGGGNNVDTMPSDRSKKRGRGRGKGRSRGRGRGRVRVRVEGSVTDLRSCGPGIEFRRHQKMRKLGFPLIHKQP